MTKTVIGRPRLQRRLPGAFVRVLSKKDNQLEFALDNSDQTFASVLVDELRKDSHVTFSAYRVPHPPTGTPTVAISTDGVETPEQAVAQAVKRLSEAVARLQGDLQAMQLRGEVYILLQK